MQAGYDEIVQTILQKGDEIAPRGELTSELCGTTITYPAGTLIYRTGMNVRLAFLEAMMLVGGIFDIELIAKVAPKANLDLYRHQSDYGPRLRSQLQDAFELLSIDQDSRRAVVYLNDCQQATGPDAACTNNIQFLIRNGKLDTYVSMRSWDVVYGLPIDIVMFGFLAQVMANCLKVHWGSVKVYTGSLHCYNKTKHLANEIYSPKVFWPKDEWNGLSFFEAQKFAQVQLATQEIEKHNPSTIHIEKLYVVRPFTFQL